MEFFSSIYHPSIGILILRAGLAVIFWLHGVMKAQFRNMQPSEQLTAGALRSLRILSYVEPLGAIAILLGLLTQLTALCFAIVMFLAIPLKRKMKMPFLAIGTSGGWEFELIVLLAAASVVLLGPGRISLDHLLFGI